MNHLAKMYFTLQRDGAAALRGMQGDNPTIDAYHGRLPKALLAYGHHNGLDRSPGPIELRGTARSSLRPSGNLEGAQAS